MEAEYLAADVYVIPSTLEMASVSQLEAMSYSLPVICSDTNGTACYVEDGVNGFLFNPENTDDIVTAVQKALALSKEDRIRMGERNRQLCLERNTEEVFLKSYEELINRL